MVRARTVTSTSDTQPRRRQGKTAPAPAWFSTWKAPKGIIFCSCVVSQEYMALAKVGDDDHDPARSTASMRPDWNSRKGQE